LPSHNPFSSAGPRFLSITENVIFFEGVEDFEEIIWAEIWLLFWGEILAIFRFLGKVENSQIKALLLGLVKSFI
jgi:hypothetical protein